MQTGSPLALSESFAVYGACLTGDEMRYILNYQLVRGIDLFNFMSMPVTVEKHFAFQMRPHFHPAIPGFSALDSLTGEITRECIFMASGLHAAETALYYPYETILEGPRHCAAAAEAFREAGNALEDAGCDFDLIDADTLLASPVVDGLLRAGSAAYARIVIPDGIEVSGAVRERLRSLRGTARETVTTGDGRLLYRVNRDGDGKLFIAVFNRSRETVTACIRVDTSLPLSLLDPKTGRAAPFPNGEAVTLCSGQCALILASCQMHPDPLTESPGPQIPLHPVDAFRSAVFRLTEKGASLDPVSEPLPAAAADGMDLAPGFCGEVTCTYRFSVGKPAGLLLCLDSLSGFAEVILNGKRVGSVSTSPYVLRIGEGYAVPGENLLTLKVSTLPAAAYAAAPAESWFSRAYLGP